MTALNDTILEKFEQLTYKNSMGCENNIHYYNGWRTNDAYKINKRVVIPMYGTWDDIFKKYHFSYDLKMYLQDLERVFTYLGGNIPESCSVGSIREAYYTEFKHVEFGYFYVTLYKKGTCHIEFKDMELLKRFNVYAGKRKGWLPGSYGMVMPENMSAEDLAVVESFEGVSEYKKDLKSIHKFLMCNNNNMQRYLQG